ncbi:VaNADium chloroperoxidase protein [Rutstroemia sp. NJR-2017a BVV2]|nr:VaNADium chloroperoxidase protein [Rutstroemia sp. NJR-2017a BVV2]
MYLADQTNVLANSTVIGGLQSPPSGWVGAIVHGAIYQAATTAAGKSHGFQQLAVSHAAHNALIWVFHGTRNYAPTNVVIRHVIPLIGLTGKDSEAAIEVGREAARKVITARTDDKINDFVDYIFQTPAPGVYQNTSGGAAFPDTPQARFVRLFADVGDVSQFKVAPPPDPRSPEYEEPLEYVKAQGARNSTVRRPFDTETAYYWRESSISQWTRFANAAVGNSLANDVFKSAKYYAQLNYALANAGIAAWHAKYQYNAWRPITAIHYTDTYLSSGKSVYDPNWTPFLTPTPSHQDYVSTHATFGSAAAQAIRNHIGTDAVDITVSSNVTVDNVGVVTRHYTNLTYATVENGDSRVFGGIHFSFASVAGNKLGTEVAVRTLEKFEKSWDKY